MGESTDLIGNILAWQEEAKHITPPENTGVLAAQGGLPGPAFFPEGLGLQNVSPARAEWPTIMAIGHYFGSKRYRSAIDTRGREDDRRTWLNLENLLRGSDVEIERCYMTNWFVGLHPEKQVGEFLPYENVRYEDECRNLLLKQIRTLRPKAILLLGLNVVRRAYKLIPRLEPWQTAIGWRDVDSSKIGSVLCDADVLDSGIRTNIVALLHPSFAPSNQRHRCEPETELIRKALKVYI